MRSPSACGRRRSSSTTWPPACAPTSTGSRPSPGRLDAVEERLDALDRLKRKHGGSIEAVLAHAERCRTEIERLENAEEVAGELAARIGETEARRGKLAAKLSAARRDAAGKLGERVAAELAELAMDGARLEVVLEPHPEGFGPSGAETVELLVSTNPGMPTLAAQGRRLGRRALADHARAHRPRPGETADRTLVFDEIDAGVGGATARAVGERLRAIAAGQQVLCITHLPQVASLAATHFVIEKAPAAGGTLATVDRVAGDELVAEIVRMLGAESGDAAASRHARQLLKAA